MINPNPDCDKECRYTFSPSSMTDAYFVPIYDKTGRNINPDGNTSTCTASCITCGKSWKATTQYGETKYEELK